jgi:hypothetical protein
LFLRLFKPISKALADRSTVLIAADPDDPETILGFIVYEKRAVPVVHFLKVKGELEGKGIAKALLGAAGITLDAPAVYTFASPETRAARLPAWSYVPFYLIPKELMTK